MNTFDQIFFSVLSLDEAWAEAEAALPEGWDGLGPAGGWDLAVRALTWDGSGTYVATAQHHDFVSGALVEEIESPISVTPAAALYALTEKLREFSP